MTPAIHIDEATKLAHIQRISGWKNRIRSLQKKQTEAGPDASKLYSDEIKGLEEKINNLQNESVEDTNNILMTPDVNFEDLIEDLSAEDFALLSEGKLEDLNIAIDKHTKKLSAAVRKQDSDAAEMHRQFINKLRRQKAALAEGVEDIIESSFTDRKAVYHKRVRQHANNHGFTKQKNGSFHHSNGESLTPLEAEGGVGHSNSDGKIIAVKNIDDLDRHLTNYRKKNESVDYSADIAVLIESDANLTEDFKEKATVIFEAAVTQKVNDERLRLVESFEAKLASQAETNFGFLVKKVDDYLTEAVEGWIEENRVAIDSGLRTEIAESFIESLKGVFNEHYIDVPANKTDLVDQLANELDALKESFSAKEDEAILLAESIENLTREKILIDESSQLIDTQAAKLLELVEDIEFVSEEAFRKKVTTIKESFFGTVKKPVSKSQSTLVQARKPGVIVEDVEDFTPMGSSSASPLMDSVLSVMKQMQKNQ